MDSDLTSGSGTVKIGGKEVSQENSSKYSKCSGDEAGAAPKKGLVTSKNTGSVYAQKWSTDVKVEGKGVVRFGDMATSNHACNPGDAPPMVITGKPGSPDYTSQECLVGSWEDIHQECNARKDADDPKKDKSPSSSDPKDFHAWQAHHIVPDRCYRVNSAGDRMEEVFPSREDGICICLPRKAHSAARPASGVAVTVHHHLDDALTKLGQQVDLPSNPSGVESARKVRNKCLRALAKLVDDPVTAECYKTAAKAVREQTDDFVDSKIRAEKSSGDLTAKATKVLEKVTSP